MDIDMLVNEVRENSIDIGGSNNNYDFDFLKPILNNKRFVFLGESSHCVKEYSVAKVTLIKFLHDELGFNILAYESELCDCTIGDHVSTGMDPMKFMSGSIGRPWHNEYVLELFNYMKETKQRQPLRLTGIDVQQSEGKHFTPFIQTLLTESLQRTFMEFEKRTNEILSDNRLMKRRRLRNSVSELYRIGNELIRELEKQLEKQSFPNTLLKKIVIRSMENRLMYCKATVQKGFSELFEYRDELMAKNLEFLAQEVYPNEKFIIWAHNFHIRKKSTASRFSPYKSIVENLPHDMKEDSFVFGLYAKEGNMGDYEGNEYPIKKPGKKHLEWLLHHTPYPNCYITSGLKWGESKWRVFEGGGLRTSLIPAQQYDGILFFKKVNPAYFIKQDYQGKYKVLL
jgi:erythromycin esterase